MLWEETLSRQDYDKLSNDRKELLNSTALVLFSSDKATHPTNRQEDWEYIIGFCDQVNKELEGYKHS